MGGFLPFLRCFERGLGGNGRKPTPFEPTYKSVFDFWAGGLATGTRIAREGKSETRISKFETNPNEENRKSETAAAPR
jgi:hypothetical protein